MKTPREKYENDAQYRVLVDLMVTQIETCQYTPSEMREAAVLACILYEQTRLKMIAIPRLPKEITDKLDFMDKWVNDICKCPSGT